MTREEVIADSEARVLFSGLICPCEKQELVCSLHRHDYRTCSCGKLFIDGGRDYLRCGIEGDDFIPIKRAAILVEAGKIVFKLGEQEFRTKGE